MMQIRSQLKSNLLEIQNYEKRQRDLEAQISAYQGRLNLTPETEQDLSDISRGYEESKSNYDSLLKKQNQSQLATSLQERQQGEQFTMIDPPSLPDKPASPNHLLMSLGGLVFAIAEAIGLTVFLEFTNARIRHEEDLSWLLPVSVMVDIPHLSASGEQGHRVRLRKNGNSSGNCDKPLNHGGQFICLL
jgi:polysaccharide biosynthesis transport protein